MLVYELLEILQRADPDSEVLLYDTQDVEFIDATHARVDPETGNVQLW